MDDMETRDGRRAPHCGSTTARWPFTRLLAERGPGDTVLLAGKGHETYQIIGTTKRIRFDERTSCGRWRSERAMSWTECRGPRPRWALALGPGGGRSRSRGVSTDTRRTRCPARSSSPSPASGSMGTTHLAAAPRRAGRAAPWCGGAPRRCRGSSCSRCDDTAGGLWPAGAGPPAEDHRAGGGHHRNQRQDQHQGNAGGGARDAVYRVHATRANLNNLIGVPLTILEAPAEHRGAGGRGGRQRAGRNRAVPRDHRADGRGGHQRVGRAPGGIRLAGGRADGEARAGARTCRWPSWAPNRPRSPRGPGGLARRVVTAGLAWRRPACRDGWSVDSAGRATVVIDGPRSPCRCPAGTRRPTRCWPGRGASSWGSTAGGWRARWSGWRFPVAGAS